MRLFGTVHAHPTTVLGLQAVLATGSAMLVARLLHMDHSNWVFWTAFVVIAGSTGESLRKMLLRVVGTVAGVAVGVALAVVAPDNTALVVGIAAVCIFLAIYAFPLSYPQMVFWLNVGFVMAYTRLGAKALDLLVARPLTTFVGALVAALVVVFVFPIRTGDHFKAAAVRFLDAVDSYVSTFVATATGGEAEQPLDAAHAKVTATYARVEQTLPGVVFENNPLLQAESPLSHQATRIAALEAEVTQLSRAAFAGADAAPDPAAVEWMRGVQRLVHGDIQAIASRLSGERGGALASTPTEPEVSARAWTLAQEVSTDQTQPTVSARSGFRTSGGEALTRIRRITAQLASELDVSGDRGRRAEVS